MQEDGVLRLTPEELSLLQSVLKIAVLPGFAPDLLPDLDDAQEEQALAIADHTLRARGLVGWNTTGHRIINPTLSRLLLDYAQPSYTLFVDTYVASRRAIPFLYVFGQQGIYEQCQPESDVVQIRVLASREALEQRLHPKLTPGPRAAAYTQGHIIQKFLNAGIKVVRESEVAAQQLFALSLWRPLATGLAIAYHEPQVVQYMACWEQMPTQERPIPNAALTILQGQEESYLLWVEEPSKGENARVAVQSASDERLHAYLEQLLPPRYVDESNS